MPLNSCANFYHCLDQHLKILFPAAVIHDGQHGSIGGASWNDARTLSGMGCQAGCSRRDAR